ncbi:MAG: hypothetical protein OEZ43_03095 [Gammaproteobacteria bacterium]|nr:hypothetical protein [Gammaproteobacteria bacterium]
MIKINHLSLCVLLFVLPSGIAHAGWQMESKLGVFQPNYQNWATYYGKDWTGAASLSIAYKPIRLIAIGVDMVYLRASGDGGYQSSGALGGEVTHEMAPGSAYLELSGYIFRNQWVVPFVGGAYGRMTYRQQVTYQPDIIGNLYGSTVFAGARILLDGLDLNAAKLLREDYGIAHSYLTLELRRLSAEKSGQDLGGNFLFGGLNLLF